MLKEIIDKYLNRQKGTQEDSRDTNAIDHHSWYDERYENVLTQRNFLALISIGAFIALIVAIFAVGKISVSKSFAPFVIQIEEKTGYAKVVNPTNSNLISGNESLTRYFIKKYLIARESYNPVDFENNLRRTVRLMSTPNVFRDFVGYIKSPANDPTILYGEKNTTYVRIKSFTKLQNQYFVRFSLVETAGNRNTREKIATITAEYIPMELNDEDRDINPIGFQITGYRVDDDNS